MINFLSIIWIGLLAMVASCQTTTTKDNLKVAATSVPHAEILEFVKPQLEKEGIELKIYIVDDYNLPNRALVDREIDANFFQHIPFLESQIHDFGYKIEPFIPVHLEPMAIYSQSLTDLKSLKEGSLIAVPSDPTNQARALALLENNGLMTFKNSDIKTTIYDIATNPHHYKLIEMDAPLLTRSLEDVDIAVINANFALLAGLSPEHDSLATEDGHSRFVNYVVIRKEDENRSDLQALKRALSSDSVKKFIQERYKGAISPAF